MRSLLRDSKGDPVINTCNRALHTKGQFQEELLSWSTLAPVFDEFYKTHVAYEKAWREKKIDQRNKKKTLLITNGDVLYKDAAGG